MGACENLQSDLKINYKESRKRKIELDGLE